MPERTSLTRARPVPPSPPLPAARLLSSPNPPDATPAPGTPVAAPGPPDAVPPPAHVAIIMDGNGRWAARRARPRAEGHRRGVANIRRVVSALAERGVSVVTLYAFSTENWRRPTNEVDSLMTILAEEIEPQTRALHEAGVRLVHLGDPRPLDAGLQDAIARAEQVTRHNAGVTLNIAFNYGGRHEILQAVRRILNDAIPPEQVDETLFGRYLYTKGSPDPDLIIRTGGEQRISNFLLWQAAYSEYYHTPALWPDLDAPELDRALRAYAQRRRRFGALDASPASPPSPPTPASPAAPATHPNLASPATPASPPTPAPPPLPTTPVAPASSPTPASPSMPPPSDRRE